MTSVSLTKKERGRLKKLRSRISLNGNGVNGNGMSGIISFKEAEEFKELFKKHLKDLKNQDCFNPILISKYYYLNREAMISRI